MTDGTVRHGQQKAQRPVATVVKFVAIGLCVLLVSAGSIGAITVWQLAGSIKHGVHLAGQSAPPPGVSAIDGPVTLLITGTDTRTGQDGYQNRAGLAASSGAGNNDVNILLHLSADHKNATVVSFPRDLEIPIPACPRDSGGTTPATSRAMLNTTLSRGGLSCDALTLSKLTGLQIPYAAVISFDGVVAMSNAIGGVEVCLATPVKDPYTNPPLDLAAGQQTLVGNTALQFLRSRHGVGDGGDLGRISNQQLFMSALARKVVSGGVLGNPLALYPLAKAAVGSITPSESLSNPMTLVTIGLALKNVGLENMVFLQYPTVADPADHNRVVPDQAAAATLTAALLADQPVQLSGKPGVGAELQTGTPGTPPVPPSAPASPPSAVVTLPPSVTGQTADQQTCTKGR
jgi:LCP family protein required for cell wall assembly